MFEEKAIEKTDLTCKKFYSLIFSSKQKSPERGSRDERGEEDHGRKRRDQQT